MDSLLAILYFIGIILFFASIPYIFVGLFNFIISPIFGKKINLNISNGIRRVFFSLTKEDLNQIIKLNTDFIEEKYKELERFSLLPNVDELLKHKLQVFKKMLEEAYLEIAWQHRCTKGWLPRRKLKAAMEYLELYIKKSEQLLQKK